MHNGERGFKREKKKRWKSRRDNIEEEKAIDGDDKGYKENNVIYVYMVLYRKRKSWVGDRCLFPKNIGENHNLTFFKNQSQSLNLDNQNIFFNYRSIW